MMTYKNTKSWNFQLTKTVKSTISRLKMYKKPFSDTVMKRKSNDPNGMIFINKKTGNFMLNIPFPVDTGKGTISAILGYTQFEPK